MDERLATLETILDKTIGVMTSTGDAQHPLPTPCSELNVEHLLEHMAVWAKVFDAAVNDNPVGFDPETHQVGPQRSAVFAQAARSIVASLRQRGWDRVMTMTSSPVPGEVVVNMLLIEYLGHGWDLARAIGTEPSYTDHEAEVALEAGQAILKPQYRDAGMFNHEVDPGEAATPLDKLVAFLGRSPGWAPATTTPASHD